MANFKPNFEVDLDVGLNNYKAKMQAALSALSQKGFGPLQPPAYNTPNGPQVYRGELPHDLTSLTDDQLGYYMGLLSEWNAFVQFQLAEYDSHLSAAKSELSLVEANLRMSFKYDEENKKRSNPERDDCVKCDQRFNEADGNVIYWETKWRYAKAIAFSAEQSFNAVSRRITQRGQEVDRHRRDGNISNGTNIPNGPMFGRR